MKNLWQRIIVFAASGFGLGFSPFAPGTTGTLPGLLIVWLLFPRMELAAQILCAIVLTLLAVPLCDVAENFYGKKDDRRIVADEYLTFPICMIGLPATPAMLGIAFVTCRIFDIIKPPPARQLQVVPGGKGIVMDDFFSCLYSLAANHALFYFLKLG